MISSSVRMWKTVRTSEKPQFGFGEALGFREYLLKPWVAVRTPKALLSRGGIAEDVKCCVILGTFLD